MFGLIQARRFFMRSMGRSVAITVFSLVFLAISLQPSFAQKLVDPDKVAPEYREAAVKRRAEQMKISGCNKKAELAKVLPRDRAAHVQHCLDEE
jgi:hypothetical protein